MAWQDGKRVHCKYLPLVDSGLSQHDKTIKINRKALFAVNVQLRRINVDETGYKVYARTTRKKKAVEILQV